MPKKKRTSESGGTYVSPGVYVEEVSTGSKPIEGVGTAVAAFVGFARRHPVLAILAGLLTLGAIAAVLRAARS
jgi:phage tail sheath protein FI